MGGNTSFHLSLTPGRYFFETWKSYELETPFLLPIEVEAGRRYFVLAEAGDQSRLTVTSEDQGLTDVLASRLLALSTDFGEPHPLSTNTAGVMIPLSIGVYYSPEFLDQAQQNIVIAGKTKIYEIPLGMASKWALNRALMSAFEHVVELPAWPPAAETTRDLDLLLVLRTNSSNWSKSPRTMMAYSVDVYATSLELITNLSNFGIAMDESEGWQQPVYYKERMKFWSAAMDNAAGGLTTALVELPQVAAKCRERLPHGSDQATPLPDSTRTTGWGLP